MDDPSPRLLILGASTRAAALSTKTAGWQVCCGDMFGDADLREMGQVEVVRDFPAGLEEVALHAPSGPWMYTGALENHPRLVERIAAMRPLMGNGADVLRRVRDPFELMRTLENAGLKTAECRTSDEGLPCDGTWLRKRKKSAGGLHLEEWRGAKEREADAASWYFQRRIEGTCCSAAYVAAEGKARLIGATEQLVGPQFGQAVVPTTFCYAGSIGPSVVSDEEREILQRIGNVLAAEFELRGLFGVDLIGREANFWPIEVNPRYTASMEVLEWASGQSMVGWHIAACREGKLPDECEPLTSAGKQLGAKLFGKAIVYAAREATVTAEATALLLAANEDRTWPVVADIPMAGVSLLVGHPAATVFAEGVTRGDVMERLRESVRWCGEVLNV